MAVFRWCGVCEHALQGGPGFLGCVFEDLKAVSPGCEFDYLDDFCLIGYNAMKNRKHVDLWEEDQGYKTPWLTKN